MMPNILLTADLHLTDKPEDEYRWAVFDSIEAWASKNPDGWVIIAGDICDRKDRHSGALVNKLFAKLGRLVTNLTSTGCNGVRVIVLRGNHDTPLNGPPFWKILDFTGNLYFISEPHLTQGGLLLLPHSNDPAQDWPADLLDKAEAIIMHQTVTGAMGNNGHLLVNEKMPELSAKIPIYSGDIHTTQIVTMPNGAEVAYIGAPHPVKYGDDYPCQYLILSGESYEIEELVELNPPQRLMLDIKSCDDFEKVKVSAGDSAKVRVHLRPSDVPAWPQTLDEIRQTAEALGLHLASVEPVIADAGQQSDAGVPEALLASPVDVLAEFQQAENIDGALASVGQSILQKVLNARASS